MKSLYWIFCMHAFTFVFVSHTNAQFTADMHIKTPNKENVYYVLNDCNNYRYEFEKEGMKLFVLV